MQATYCFFINRLFSYLGFFPVADKNKSMKKAGITWHHIVYIQNHSPFLTKYRHGGAIAKLVSIASSFLTLKTALCRKFQDVGLVFEETQLYIFLNIISGVRHQKSSSANTSKWSSCECTLYTIRILQKQRVHIYCTPI